MATMGAKKSNRLPRRLPIVVVLSQPLQLCVNRGIRMLHNAQLGQDTQCQQQRTDDCHPAVEAEGYRMDKCLQATAVIIHKAVNDKNAGHKGSPAGKGKQRTDGLCRGLDDERPLLTGDLFTVIDGSHNAARTMMCI